VGEIVTGAVKQAQSIPAKIGSPKRIKFMVNPPNFYPNSGSYDELLKHMTQRMQQHKVDNQIFELLLQVFEKELSQGRIVLSRPERVRLFQQVSKAILTEGLRKIGDTT
jgi:hypothetical protein